MIPEQEWKRYEYVSQTYVSSASIYIPWQGMTIFLKKNGIYSYLLQCVSKSDTKYLFERYIIPHYDRGEADVCLHLASEEQEEGDTCTDIQPYRVPRPHPR